MSLITSLKRLRNGAAHAISRLVCAVPILERPMIFCGRLLGDGPILSSFYREVRTQLARFLFGEGRDLRLVELGPVKIRFSIAHFTMHGFWFNGLLYEEATFEALKQKLHAGSTFVDIGANAGYFSIIAGTLVGRLGKVIACEPNPTVFAGLQRHVAANKLQTTVTTYQTALSDADHGVIDLFLPLDQHNDGLASIIPFDSDCKPGQIPSSKPVRVACTSFDCLAARIGLTGVDLMKIDVEGAEDQVISGMERFLSQWPPKAIILETRLDSRAFLTLLQKGYSARLMDRLDSANGNYLFELKQPAVIQKQYDACQ